MTFNFERSLLTEDVVTILRSLNDDAITYEDLAHRAVTSIERIKSVLDSARRILARDHMLFGVIHGVGLQRLDEHGKALKTDAQREKLRRGAHRGKKIVETIDMERLTPREQLMVTTNRTIFNAVSKETRKPKPQKLSAPTPLPDTGKLLKLRQG